MAMLAMFSALMVGAGWALALVPNIEFVSLLAFVAGATLGIAKGALAGAVGMFLFSATNPVGSGLAFPLLLGSQLIAMALTGAIGGLFHRVSPELLSRLPWRALLAGTGFLLTLVYDGLTSVSFPLFAGAGSAEIWAVLISGLIFTLMHQISNTALFFFAGPALIRIGRRSQQPALTPGTG